MANVAHDLTKKPLPESFLEIKDHVKIHAQVAYTLAILERRPPGYTVELWAIHLMSLSQEALRSRLVNRYRQEENHLGPVSSIGALVQHPMSVLPSIPDRIPAELIPRIRELEVDWCRDLLDRKCSDVLVAVPPGPRTAERFRHVERQIRQVVLSIARGTLTRTLPWKVKLHINKEGYMHVTLTELR